jgi:uncharacterized membrane protein
MDDTVDSQEQTNIRAIVALERKSRESRSLLERLTDVVSGWAASRAFVVMHVLWFAVWIELNLRGLTFDPYPFNLLTLAVSLEAIVLTSFVLMAQNRMSREADKRSHLDLQINLLAEQELTAILKLQGLLAEHAGIDVASILGPTLHQLLEQTDVGRLSADLDQALETSDK